MPSESLRNQEHMPVGNKSRSNPSWRAPLQDQIERNFKERCKFKLHDTVVDSLVEPSVGQLQ